MPECSVDVTEAQCYPEPRSDEADGAPCFAIPICGSVLKRDDLIVAFSHSLATELIRSGNTLTQD
jgi:hypothetical protein